MVQRRSTLARLLAEQLGPSVMRLEDEHTGWPSYCQIATDNGWVDCALHIGPIGLSQRDRDDVERRFQNPGKDRPMSCPPGRKPLLIGAKIAGDEEAPRITVLAGFGATRRLGKATRFSLFMPVSALEAAEASGWFDHQSHSDETIHLFRPELLPVFAAMEDDQGPLPEIEGIIDASGLNDAGETAGPVERVYRSALRAVRDSTFRRKVVRAYGGQCAMCGLAAPLTEGAHIYPATAPGSPDTVWNGMALCPNHHRAFDLHLLAPDPRDFVLRVHPQLAEEAQRNTTAAAFLRDTYNALAVPADPASQPNPRMFESRYEYFKEAYSWLLR